MTDKKEPRMLKLKRMGEPGATDAPRMEERLHKVLAQAGLGSRRALEQRIADGLVKVNGEVATVGQSVGSGDKVDIDGRQFIASALTEAARVLLYNKPEGEVTTREDPEGRPTIFEALPALKGARWIAIGRLDINTTGLLLLTTDGELANALMHPSFEVEREYVCRVRAPEGEDVVSDAIVERLQRGISLEDGPAKFDEVERVGGSDSHDWFRVLLKEGRNREVRRLWESQGCQVSRLKRVRYGSVSLPRELLRGHSQELASDKVGALRLSMGLEDGAPSALTLQPVIGQRKAAKSSIDVAGRARANSYVGGHTTAADEGRELRRFDNVREDRGRGRFGNKKPHGGLTVSGEAAANQANRPFKQRSDKNPRALPEGNPAAFRSWYVPDGVDTGPTGHRNAGPEGRRKPYGGKPAGGKPGGAGFKPRGEGGYKPRGEGGFKPRGEGGFNNERGPGGPNSRGPGGERGPRGPGNPYGGAGERGPGAGAGRPHKPRSYGNPGAAPNFPSDHANPGGFNPYGSKPAGPRPANRGPGGPRPGGPKPGGARPNGPRPGGPRPGGPRGGGRPGGGRGPQG